MKILWFLFVVHTTFGQTGFGKSYLRNSRLCHQWSCINRKLNLPDALPNIDQFNTTLRSLLPPEWHSVVDSVVSTCYNDRPRRYTNTCPGQAILHCAVDQLVANCPDSSLRKDDYCTPVNSLAGGLHYMFSQSRYENMEKSLKFDKRPAWFLKNYFDSKCCNLPPLFDLTSLSQCGFSSMMMYMKHGHQVTDYKNTTFLPQKKQGNIFGFEAHNETEGLHLESLKPKNVHKNSISEPINPLDCIDISGLIRPEWRGECGFELRWSELGRLQITDGEGTVPPPTVATVTHRDLVVVPQTCEKTTCVFDKLNITWQGTVDLDAFKRILDNLTHVHPTWNKAKARVLTTCLTKPLTEYDADCEINKVLACTFDVLSENCPISETSYKHDACKPPEKGSEMVREKSPRWRPSTRLGTATTEDSFLEPSHGPFQKNRRSACVVPELVESSLLQECRLPSLHKVEQVVTTVVKPKKVFAWEHKCKSITPSTSCLMAKMGVLNKYGFIDYFKMWDKIRNFTSDAEWSTFNQVYLGSFSNGPLYSDHCNSAKKILNVLDTMLISCPASKRSSTPQCTALLNEITTTPVKQLQRNEHVLEHFHEIFYPHQTPILNRPRLSKLIKKPMYDFGILTSNYAPNVKLIDVKPHKAAVLTKSMVERKPVVIRPVYMRPHSNLVFTTIYKDGVLRSPFNMHKEIYQSCLPTPVKVYPKPVSSPIFP